MRWSGQSSPRAWDRGVCKLPHASRLELVYGSAEGWASTGMWGVWFLTHRESQLQAGEAVRQYTARREKNSQQERSIGSKGPVCGCRSRSRSCRGAPRSVALENRGGWWCWREDGSDFPAWAGRIKQVAGRSDRLKGQVTAVLQAASCFRW